MKVCRNRVMNKEGMPTSFLKENKPPGNKNADYLYCNKSQSEEIGAELKEMQIWSKESMIQFYNAAFLL